MDRDEEIRLVGKLVSIDNRAERLERQQKDIQSQIQWKLIPKIDTRDRQY